jgi:hypothetical protein
MATATASQLVAEATCLNNCVIKGIEKPIMIWLLCQIAGVTPNASALQADAACLACIIPGMRDPIIIYLLAQIAANGGTGGGGGGSAAVTCGNYGGGAPTFTPTTPCALAVDTSGPRLWIFSNGVWN